MEAREFNNKDLASNETTAALEYVKTFDSHHYPQSGPSSNLTSLMNHAEIVSRAAAFKGEVAAAKSKGKIHVFGETNSGKRIGTRSFERVILTPLYSNSRWRRY